MSSNDQNSSTNVDEDLDELLDSALEDFEKIPQKSSKKEKIKTEKDVEKELMDLLGKVGFSGDAGLESLNQELLNMSKLSGEGGAGPGGVAGTSLQDALLQLSKDSENLKEIPSEEEMQKVLGSLSTDSLEQGLGNLLPMMEGMMQSLLSKELLYPAMKDMNDKFPDWLADHRQSLAEEEFSKYNRQYDLTRKICHEFENENEGSSAAEKKVRFERIMENMQEMQELGQPPKELVGEGGFQMDAMAGGLLPGAPEQCVVS